MKTIDEEKYVQKAENVICALKNKKDSRGNSIAMVTTSKIRNLLSMTSDIYNEVSVLPGDTLSKEIISRIEYLKIRFVYEVGRDNNEATVKNFVEESEILDILNEIGDSKSNYLLFSRYMEALVAYHKFYGGKDWEDT